MKASLTLMLVVALLPRVANAAPPLLDPGTCTYLVGVPPGGPAASDVETLDGISVEPTCLAIHAVSTRATEPNSVQMFQESSGIASADEGCFLKGWVGHAFVVSGSGPAATTSIDVTGAMDGSLTAGSFVGESHIRALIVLEEGDPLTGQFIRIAQATAIERTPTESPQQMADSFNVRLQASVTPGRQYRVVLEVSTIASERGNVHFGPPGADRGVWYDSIQVCIDAPVDPTAPLAARIDALELADLEARLYERQCMPRVWMPEAQGGQLAAARDLVALRLGQATSTGDPGVNTRVATARLASADASIAAGQFQRACRDLSEGLRALTTP